MVSSRVAANVTGRRTQAERSESSERAMLDATARLIAEKGFAKTSLVDIGELSGYSRGLVSHKFGSKEAIVKQLVEEIARDTILYTSDKIDQRKKQPHIARLCGIMDRYLDTLQSEDPRSRAMFILMFESLTVVPNLKPLFESISNRFVQEIAALIEQAKQQSEIPKNTQSNAAAAGVVASVRGITMMWLLSDGSFDLPAARAEFQLSLTKRFG